jgi:hypothetical protein
MSFGLWDQGWVGLKLERDGFVACRDEAMMPYRCHRARAFWGVCVAWG